MIDEIIAAARSGNFSPANIAVLLDEIARLRDDNARLRAEAFVSNSTKGDRVIIVSVPSIHGESRAGKDQE